MVRVKVCGITNSEDASKAVYYGAWAIGFVFTKNQLASFILYIIMVE